MSEQNVSAADQVTKPLQEPALWLSPHTPVLPYASKLVQPNSPQLDALIAEVESTVGEGTKLLVGLGFGTMTGPNPDTSAQQRVLYVSVVLAATQIGASLKAVEPGAT